MGNLLLANAPETSKQDDRFATTFSTGRYYKSIGGLSPSEGNLLREWLATNLKKEFPCKPAGLGGTARVKSKVRLYFDDKTGDFLVSAMNLRGGIGRFGEICNMCESELEKVKSEPDYFRTIGIKLALHKTYMEESAERPTSGDLTSELAMLSYPFVTADFSMLFRKKERRGSQDW